MSDFGRKDLTSQVTDKITPDSQKSTTEKASENVSGAYDKVAGSLQPEGNKSTTQKAGDTFRSGADDTQAEGKGFVASAQDTLGSISGAASEKVKGAADYVSGTTQEKTS